MVLKIKLRRKMLVKDGVCRWLVMWWLLRWWQWWWWWWLRNWKCITYYWFEFAVAGFLIFLSVLWVFMLYTSAASEVANYTLALWSVMFWFVTSMKQVINFQTKLQVFISNITIQSIIGASYDIVVWCKFLRKEHWKILCKKLQQLISCLQL